MENKIYPQKWLKANRETVNTQWFEFLRFKSVGTDPACLDDCRECSAWLKRWLNALGFVVDLLGPDNAPKIVFAVRKGEGDLTAMFYGHYDVQPATVEDGWDSNPWEPSVRSGRVYARGAQDNKGQVWASLQAIRACIEEGSPLPNLKIVLDGQEESGSDELIKLIGSRPDLFTADVLMVGDTSMMEDHRPAIMAGLRGVSSLSVRLDGASYDLHSGMHGGLAPNPVMELARIVAEMHADDGSIAVEGFMDDVAPLKEEELSLALSEPFDETAYQERIGVPPIGGKRGVAPQVRGSLMPTIEVNGFHGGYGGLGAKTIIPASAEVKLSMRTVLGQTPEKCLDAVRRHFEDRVKPGMKLSFSDCKPGAPAFRVAVDSPMVMKARKILSSMHSNGCAIKYEGGSIHVVGLLANVCGGDAVMAGFGLEEDRIHAPNESFSFAQFELCVEYTAKFLEKIGEGL